MSNSKDPTSTRTVSSAKLERELRLSLPENEATANTKASSAKLERKLRMSLNETETSQRSTTAKKKPKVSTRVSITPSIPEDENPDFVMETETKPTKISRQASTTSKASGVGSSKSPRPTLTYDNGAYEGNLKTSDSRPPSKSPSVQSLEIYREQYCCCAKRTRCERYLFVTVAVLGIIIVVLVIVIVILAKNGTFENNKLFSFHL